VKDFPSGDYGWPVEEKKIREVRAQALEEARAEE